MDDDGKDDEVVVVILHGDEHGQQQQRQPDDDYQTMKNVMDDVMDGGVHCSLNDDNMAPVALVNDVDDVDADGVHVDDFFYCYYHR